MPAFLTRNWSLKLAALALAVLLWMVVRVDVPTFQAIPGIAVRVVLTDPRWALKGEPVPSQVEVRFSGPARELIQLAFNRPTLLIPIDSVVARDTVLVLRRDWVSLPGRLGVTAEDVTPSSVRLEFEPIETAVLPFAPRLEGSPPEGWTFAGDVEVIPERANVSGPASRLEAIDSIPLLPIAFGDIEESAPASVRVDGARLQQVVVAPTEAEVRIRLEPRAERVFEQVPVEVLGRPDLTSEPAAGSVVLVGPQSRVDAADDRVLRIVVDIGLLPDSLPLPARLPVRVEGAPRYVTATPQFDSVTIRPRRSP
ncbi:MAG: hypothetical protein HY701_03910 [Gemmatimonadetes bacterium]|nr:hypothetical protein [Gemmatimonadota bacterium]